MAEPSTLDFEGLRTLLESTTVQPRFRDLRRRRLQRTQVSAVAAVAAGLVLAVTGALLGTRPAAQVAPVDPVPTSTAVPGPDSPGQRPIETVAVGSTLVSLWTRCVPDCVDRHAELRRVILASDDLGRSWHIRSEPPWLALDPDKLAAGDMKLFAADGDLWAWAPLTGVVAHSGDAGRTWSLAAAAGPSVVRGVYRGWAGSGLLWLDGVDGLYVIDRALGTRRATRPEPSEITLVVPVDADRTLVAVARSPGGIQPDIDWYATGDRGDSWTAIDGPCAASPVPQSIWVGGTRATDGSLWVACSGPAGDLRARTVVVVSTDQGAHWRAPADAEDLGVVIHITAFSATEAWRWGDRTNVYRTTDGTQWTDVGLTKEGPSVVIAVSADVAVVNEWQGPELRVRVTTDGGRTWQSYPVRMP